MKYIGIIGAGVLLSLLATTASVRADDRGNWSYSRHEESRQDSQGNQDNQDNQDTQDSNNDNNGHHGDWKQDKHDEHEAEKSDHHERHVSRKERDRMIRDDERRQEAYRQHLRDEQRRAARAAEQLQQENREALYRQHQDYLTRLEEQRRSLARVRDYRNDPFYSTPNSYRYTRDGQNYSTNQYGAKLLRQAVNTGYSEGYRSGSAGRQDNWNGGYQNVFAYQDANMGYGGQYVSQKEYNYYFRQGFQRGYRDGYGNNRQYGDRNNSVLENVLSGILNMHMMQ